MFTLPAVMGKPSARGASGKGQSVKPLGWRQCDIPISKLRPRPNVRNTFQDFLTCPLVLVRRMSTLSSDGALITVGSLL